MFVQCFICAIFILFGLDLLFSFADYLRKNYQISALHLCEMNAIVMFLYCSLLCKLFKIY